MIKINKEIEEKLIEDIGQDRYLHSLRVLDTAIILGKIYSVDLEKINKAAIFHDCGKLIDETNLLKMTSKFDIILDIVMKYNLELVHAPLGAKIAEIKYGIDDKDVLNSIRYHTIGRENMTTLDKIIYISDYIEPGRSFPGVEAVRKMAYKDINISVLMAMENTIQFLIKSSKLIHPDTIKARNQLRILSGKV